MKYLCSALVLAIALVLSLDHGTVVEARNQAPAFDNYDIRLDATDQAVAALERMRGPKPVRRNITLFKVEYNDTFGVPEVVESLNGRQFLAAVRNGRTRADVLREFVAQNHDVFGLTSLDQLHQTADYRNPDGNLAFVRFEQYLNGIPVFGAELKGGFTKQDELFRVINNLAPELADASGDFGTADEAATAAAPYIGLETKIAPRSVERFYFPVGNGIAIPAWRVHLETADGGAYYIVVDTNGTLLWRKNLVEHQTVPATYNVYGNANSILKTADSPSPFTPGCLDPNACPQPPAVGRTDFTLIGNEAPYTFNTLGWIPDTGLPVRTPADPNITDGNNVEAGIDRVAPQGVDDNGWARTTGIPARVFSYTYNPGPGLRRPARNRLEGAGTPSQFQQGATTHGFT
jgi:hypothetical protein